MLQEANRQVLTAPTPSGSPSAAGPSVHGEARDVPTPAASSSAPSQGRRVFKRARVGAPTPDSMPSTAGPPRVAPLPLLPEEEDDFIVGDAPSTSAPRPLRPTLRVADPPLLPVAFEEDDNDNDELFVHPPQPLPQQDQDDDVEDEASDVEQEYVQV